MQWNCNSYTPLQRFKVQYNSESGSSVKEKKKDWKEYLGFEHPRKKGGKKREIR